MSDAADTAGALVAAAAAQLGRTEFDEITYKALGAEVGVSERTVYRHFPTRAHLLIRVAQTVESRLFAPSAFTTWEGLYGAVAARFAAFDAHPAEAFILARSASLSPVHTASPAGQSHSFFAGAVGALVDESAPGLNPRDRRRTASALCYFASAQFWVRVRVGFDLDAEAAMRHFRAAAHQVLRAVPEGTWPHPAYDGVVS
ncbi:TetR/AcrR family transcriptional regulator [Nesterenkonia sp. NBAIMH1]|uniref:TetR/AcrR family transcriptional regulator n=1 Tax=Nesterenkonia sp. NBAIMH1 TaxID=2600320 RepID=UPI00143D0A28|nr:TetR/AcrR family transcriptional regulator [Nesterenkonia sp. NBAIMH1]